MYLLVGANAPHAVPFPKLHDEEQMMKPKGTTNYSAGERQRLLVALAELLPVQRDKSGCVAARMYTFARRPKSRRLSEDVEITLRVHQKIINRAQSVRFRNDSHVSESSGQDAANFVKMLKPW
ncbi:hypothetical protein PC123_g19385 [Phytophthora cactorum]|nr:hypothetical protein PC120_g12956 [Phytophthora cactorum]KAG4045197.1 hypothetical protein PC123_g19385 [Phytophthora cactorum]